MKRAKKVLVKRRPIIGLTPDEVLPEGANALPRYELRRAYCDAIEAAGGLPIVLPYTKDAAVIEGHLALVEGLVCTGGNFDVPPDLYGEKPKPWLGAVKPGRTAFELALVEAALDRDLPLLGICGGMQLMNVVCGGTLFQDIAREVPGAGRHTQDGDRRLPSHEVAVTAGTLLAAATGPGTLMVNSTHHQAVRKVGRGLVVSAIAPDGVIEAIELPERRFVVGVQWHPELLGKSVPINRSLLKALVAAALERQAVTAAS